MDFYVVGLGNPGYSPYTKYFILLSEHNKIAGIQSFVVGDQAVVVIRLAGLVSVTVDAL